MSFDVAVARSVEEVGQEGWDRTSAGRPFTSYRWYRFGERAMAHAKPFYILLSRAGETVARATFWCSGTEVLWFSRLFAYPIEAMLRFFPMIICQSPISTTSTSGLILPEGPLQVEAIETILEVAQEIGRKEHASFYAFPYLEEKAMKAWPERCVHVEISGPGTQLDLAWPDVDGYLAHLNKKRRYNLRRNLRFCDKEGLVVRRHDTVDVDLALQLHRRTNKRYGSRTERWMQATLENAPMVDAVWLTAEIDGRITGCELLLGDAGAWVVTGLGLDYSVEYAYFLLGYEDICCAIERGGKLLRWGSEAYDVKRRMGFELMRNSHTLFIGSGPFQSFGYWVAKQIGMA